MHQTEYYFWPDADRARRRTARATREAAFRGEARRRDARGAMVVFDVVVEIPGVSAAEYLREKASEPYKAYHQRACGILEQRRLSERVGADGLVTTVTRTVPTIHIPWALRRAILGNKRVEFVDTRTWVHGAHLTPPFEQSFHTTNNISASCVVDGTITVTDAAPSASNAVGGGGVNGGGARCVIRARGECVVAVTGLGTQIEHVIVNNLKQSYARQPEVMTHWLHMRRNGIDPNLAPMPPLSTPPEPAPSASDPAASEPPGRRISPAGGVRSPPKVIGAGGIGGGGVPAPAELRLRHHGSDHTAVDVGGDFGVGGVDADVGASKPTPSTSRRGRALVGSRGAERGLLNRRGRERLPSVDVADVDDGRGWDDKYDHGRRSPPSPLSPRHRWVWRRMGMSKLTFFVHLGAACAFLSLAALFVSHLAERGAASTAPKVTPPKVTGGFAGAVIGGAFGDELATRTRERVARIGREEMARRAATAESKSDGGYRRHDVRNEFELPPAPDAGAVKAPRVAETAGTRVSGPTTSAPTRGGTRAAAAGAGGGTAAAAAAAATGPTGTTGTTGTTGPTGTTGTTTRSKTPPTTTTANAALTPPKTAARKTHPHEPCADERREECEHWACFGECLKNPKFMRKSCPCACEAAANEAAAEVDKRRVAFEDPAVASTATWKGVALGVDWTDVRGDRRAARVRIVLNRTDAPTATAAVLDAVRESACAPGKICGGAACHIHRVEPTHGLVQGNLKGLGKAGGKFGARTEGTRTWTRGTAGYIPGGDNLLIATSDHKEWDPSFTAFGEVVDEDMAVLDELLDLPTEPFEHPEFKTIMAMLKTKVRFTLEGAADV